MWRMLLGPIKPFQITSLLQWDTQAPLFKEIFHPGYHVWPATSPPESISSLDSDYS